MKFALNHNSTLASCIDRITGVHQHPWLEFILLVVVLRFESRTSSGLLCRCSTT
jgi:hypothetical protein